MVQSVKILIGAYWECRYNVTKKVIKHKKNDTKRDIVSWFGINPLREIIRQRRLNFLKHILDQLSTQSCLKCLKNNVKQDQRPQY